MDLERTLIKRRFVQLRPRCKQKGNREEKKIQIPFQWDEKEFERRRKRRFPRARTQRFQSVRKVKQAGVLPVFEGAMPKGIRI